MKEIKITISERLAEARKYFDFQQYKIAEKLGITQSCCASWEHNSRLIPFKHLYALSNIYNVRIDYLLGLIEDPLPAPAVELNMELISKRIKMIIYKNKKSVSEFAKSISISKSSMYYYMNGQKAIKTYVLYDIARKYNISADYICGKTNNKQLHN